MIKPNWDIFKAKFSENPQDNFEWFCYLLFCKEFKQEKGIFRFKNQSAIETNPIKHENHIIGWQAKFYAALLSNHKDKLLQTLEKAKRDYPNITKIILYTNQEWVQSKGKNPKGLIKIEKKAKELSIELEWRSKSYFEKVAIDNEIIFKHFFTLDKSIFDLIKEQTTHNEHILAEIQTNISFNKQVIEIDRNNELVKIKNTDRSVLVLSGIAGVGKTALIKNLLGEVKNEIPFYLFKATEFDNLRIINDFFKNFNFQDFIDAHKEDNGKTIIIDSAEKLLDLKNIDPFKEFLSILIENNWKIIFTIRDNYLEDLNYQFFEIYNVVPLNINLQNLEQKELTSLSRKYSFQLPQDEKLWELIKNPFYLKEYLKCYDADETLNYKKFKDELWNKDIKKSKPARSECFLKIALERANKGSFFILPMCEASILDEELVKDGILGYEDSGYFITHDIYEEWALEKIIDREFSQKNDNPSFFKAIGQSLPIRRSFRNWVSEKLLLESEEIKKFIEEIISDTNIDQFWKDEILISVLLSDYAETFFEIFKAELLENNQVLLERLAFLLRLACKEVDENYFKQLGILKIDLSILKYALIKPKGNGWKSIIKFVFDNLDTIGIENINFILPIIHDWNSKFKTGKTTRYASLTALQYYQCIIGKDVYYYSNTDVKDKIFQTIINGSSEIKDELRKIFGDILKNKWKNHRDPYYDLSKTILTKLEGVSVSRILPKSVLQLANLFWTYTPPKKVSFHPDPIMKVEQHFNIEDDRFEYHLASSYQTPIFRLLQSAQKETIDFILEFTNKTVEAFAKSESAKYEVQEVEIFLDKKITIKQYISERLWCMYRGTQVSPYVLASIYMALEKYFFEREREISSETLEYWLLYLLKNSKSASISAVVASVVLAFPDKTFNVAKVLFRTKDFFLHDKKRWLLDLTAKNQLSTVYGVSDQNKFYENERINSYDDKHRKWHLESLFLQYQVSGNKSVSEIEKRRKILWEILDNYYKRLPKESEQTEADKTWRMFLARMDYRRMKPTIKKTKKGIEIHWNPEIDPKLKLESEKSLEKSFESTRYNSLELWASYKMKNNKKYKEHKKYEDNPKIGLEEVKEIVGKLELLIDKDCYISNYSIPAKVCSVLIRDYFEKLSKEESNFCADIILKVASLSSCSNHQYPVTDGKQSAISVLPVLLEKFPKEKGNIKEILLFNLFNDDPIGMTGTNLNTFSITAINELWETNFDDAQSILISYLHLRPKYDVLRKKIRQENYKKGGYDLEENEVMDKFLKKNKKYLQKFINNQILIKDVGGIETIDLHTLEIAFQLIPLNTEDNDHKTIVKKIIFAFVEKFISNDRDNGTYHTVKHDFLKKLAYFVLSAPKEEIQEYIKPFIDKFNSSETISVLFEEFISAEDDLNSYENFWEVWNLFKEKIFEICKKGDGYRHIDKIIKSYLFAQNPWKESATEWHTLQNDNKRFFKDISETIGHCSSTLYSISKLLNDIGSSYLDDGVLWLSDMLDKNKNFSTVKLEVNTVDYVENLVRKYIYKNRTKIRKTKKLMERVLVILDFLIARGSVVGYILRENIV